MEMYVNLSHRVSFMEKPRIELTEFEYGNPNPGIQKSADQLEKSKESWLLD
jgi:hypothetical protein